MNESVDDDTVEALVNPEIVALDVSVLGDSSERKPFAFEHLRDALAVVWGEVDDLLSLHGRGRQLVHLRKRTIDLADDGPFVEKLDELLPRK